MTPPEDRNRPPVPRAEDAASLLGQPGRSGGPAKPGGAQAAIEGRGAAEDGGPGKDAPKPSDRLGPAGPHADPRLVNPDATPGTGALTPPGGHGDVDASSG